MDDRCHVLLVDDDPTVITSLVRSLEDLGGLRFATTLAEARRLMREQVPDLVLLDVHLPDGNGFELCGEMGRDAALSDVPVIFLTSEDDPAQELRGLELGAVDFIVKPPRGPLVRARARTHLRMKRMADALRRAADTDGLTGVANRRRFDEMLTNEWLRAQRGNTPVALLMADVDHFKAFNDHYGHVAGDHCLREVACAMTGVVRRPADLLARYGGEEFALLLPETDLEGACQLAERLVAAVDQLCVPHAASPVVHHVSLSVGVCAGWPSGLDPTCLVGQADAALYTAKADGRHRVCRRRLDELLVPAQQGNWPGAAAPSAGDDQPGADTPQVRRPMDAIHRP